MNAILKCRDIRVDYRGHTVLQGVSHEFRPCAWTHIIGANGIGKTTLLRCMAGLLRPASGSVTIDGDDVTDMAPKTRAMRIAYVPQRLESLPPITVAEFVSQGTFASTETPQNLRIRAENAIHRLGITALSERRLQEISGGELQLCMLASAIAQNADVILLDEPTASLDIRHAELICQALKSLSDITVISTTHDLSQVFRYASETVLLDDGKVAWAGTGFPPSDVLASAYDMPASYFDRFKTRVEPIDGMRNELAPEAERHTPSKRTAIAVAIVAVCLLAAICPWFGATWASPWDGSHVFWMLRIPRVIWGLFAGAVLGLVGAVLQAMFQNALATPYTLGIASGASLGAMVAIQAGIASIWALSGCAGLGGFLSMAAVLFMASRFGFRNPVYCLLGGVAVSMFCGAAGLVVQAFATPMTAQQMMHWQLGGLEIVGYDAMLCLPIVAIAICGLFLLARPIELMSVDNELAMARGADVSKTRIMALILAGIATSIIVSECGPIGFVGLIVPNAVRRFCGGNLRRVFPMSALCGAGFLVICDTISRLIERAAWIPVGVITAAIGVPVFLAMLIRRERTE
ncbi:MAG: iron chelate uptake ABC transporter family permease subunit [Proteobacteria bacterium]|nr:iron chelate uptake ABC transporter family permease subunit [Pseudomonadota bacterium]